jgi:hypothetical protein
MDYHYESIDGGKTLMKVPGLAIDEIQMRIRIKPVYDERALDLGKHLESLSTAIKKGDVFLANRLYRLRHKLDGVKYHLDNFVANENGEITKLQRENHVPGGVDMLIEEPKILYEIEAFLFQTKSTLDVLAQLVAILFDLKSVNTYSEGGANLTNSLKKNPPKNLKSIAEDLIPIVAKYRQWVLNIVDMRDEVTHYSELEGFSCFIIHTYKGGGSVDISYPAMPDGKRARNYLEKAWKTLLDMITEIMPILARVAAQRKIPTTTRVGLPEKLGGVLD